VGWCLTAGDHGIFFPSVLPAPILSLPTELPAKRCKGTLPHSPTPHTLHYHGSQARPAQSRGAVPSSTDNTVQGLDLGTDRPGCPGIAHLPKLHSALAEGGKAGTEWVTGAWGGYEQGGYTRYGWGCFLCSFAPWGWEVGQVVFFWVWSVWLVQVWSRFSAGLVMPEFLVDESEGVSGCFSHRCRPLHGCLISRRLLGRWSLSA